MRMWRLLRTLLITALLALFGLAGAARTVRADTLLLVHGYLGSAASWRNSGVAFGLTRLGWADGGHLAMGPAGPFAPRLRPPGKRRFYTLDLPSEAPLMVQADILARHVALIRRLYGAGEKIFLAGHSAGGVAARLMMVRYPGLKISALLTIASPHLGSPMADLGRVVSNSPLSWFAPLFGLNTINRSRALYYDMGRERPGNILGWLNRTPHPPAVYISVVRTRTPDPNSGDQAAPGWRQDMNMVPALRGRAKTVFSPGDHGLRPSDATLIASLLAPLSR